MDNNDYLLGEQIVLSFKVFLPGSDQFSWLPVGCITSNGLDRSRGRIETTGRGSAGNKSYRPTDKDYNLSFDGVLSKSGGLVSYNHLDQLFEDGTVFEWRMMSADGWIAKTGTSFITSLSLGTAARAWVTFSCTLSPAAGGVSKILVWSQDGLNIVSQDGTNLIEI